MTSAADAAAAAHALADAGDFTGAAQAGERALALTPGDDGLAVFTGAMWCRAGDLDRGIAGLRAALERSSDAIGVRIELCHALLAKGDVDGVVALATGIVDLAQPSGRELSRIAAHVHRLRGEYGVAEERYWDLCEVDNADFESWQGLGLTLLACGDAGTAAEALRRAVALRPTLLAAQLNLGRALLQLGQGRPALAALTAAAALDPDSVEIAFDTALAQVAARDHVAAEAGFRAVLARAPGHSGAVAGLAMTLERSNQLDTLEALLDEPANIEAPALCLARARLLKRRGHLPEALVAALADPNRDDPRRYREIGDIADRLGDSADAFAAFERMNTLDIEQQPAAEVAAADYRALLERWGAVVDAAAAAPAHPGTRAAPVFLFGFPRSGTTLLDTMLMNHSGIAVLEEASMLETLVERIGDPARIPGMTDAELASLRAEYWATVDCLAPAARERLLVDKLPLGLLTTPVLRRLFPDARYLFAERHPIDVVLSCYFNRFAPNPAMANFLRLDTAAQLYDRALDYWQRCRARSALDVHTVRYERLIADPEAELRPVMAFLGLDWSSELSSHTTTADRFIGSASYAQVAEPLYDRAAGRWRRYADEMAPVMPLLTPWIERLGYDR